MKATLTFEMFKNHILKLSSIPSQEELDLISRIQSFEFKCVENNYDFGSPEELALSEKLGIKEAMCKLNALIKYRLDRLDQLEKKK